MMPQLVRKVVRRLRPRRPPQPYHVLAPRILGPLRGEHHAHLGHIPHAHQCVGPPPHGVELGPHAHQPRAVRVPDDFVDLHVVRLAVIVGVGQFVFQKVPDPAGAAEVVERGRVADETQDAVVEGDGYQGEALRAGDGDCCATVSGGFEGKRGVGVERLGFVVARGDVNPYGGTGEAWGGVVVGVLPAYADGEVPDVFASGREGAADGGAWETGAVGVIWMVTSIKEQPQV
ncbi:hypothetical protein VTI74DRAFT_626 [Chaetomium olivicolor]